MQRSLFAGAKYGGQNALPSCSLPGAVAAPYFAVHYRRANRLLATVVGRVGLGVDQEPEPVHGMLQQMPGQTPIRFVREMAARQLFQFARQSQAVVGQGVTAQPMAAPGASQRIGA